MMSLLKKQCPDMATVQKGERVRASHIGIGSRNAALVISSDTVEQKVQVDGLPEGVSIENLMADERTVSGRVTEFTIPEDTTVTYQWSEEQP